jgi:hypothetical protein
MIVIFTGLAITGLFFMEEGEKGRSEHGRENNHVQYSEVSERSGTHVGRGTSGLSENEINAGEQTEGGEGSEEIHEISGIIWLLLMSLHTIQHWNWYKKSFSLKHLLQNKLLTVTLVLFGLLVLSSIGMWTEIIPRGLFDLKEIHGLIGQVLVGLILIHIIQRFKWYVSITRKLFGQKIIAD